MADLTTGIPFHNGVDPQYLKSSIDSILDQTVLPEKIHLLQDGPISDELKNIRDQYSNHQLIDYYKFEENIGLTRVLNYSINKTETTYYARMDADDIAYPDRFLKQVQFLEENSGVDIVGSWAIDIDEQGKKVSTRRVPTDHQDIVKYIWTNPMLHPSVMFKKASIQRVGMYNEDMRKRQDYELWFRCVKEGLQFKNIKEPLIKYRFTEDWFEKNDANVIWNQVKTGWRGCRLLGTSPMAYLGVLFPLIKILFPKKIGIQFTKMTKKIDPRNQSE
jgi:glycosyltransferase involved in cell wall biosynthesis